MATHCTFTLLIIMRKTSWQLKDLFVYICESEKRWFGISIYKSAVNYGASINACLIVVFAAVLAEQWSERSILIANLIKLGRQSALKIRQLRRYRGSIITSFIVLAQSIAVIWYSLPRYPQPSSFCSFLFLTFLLNPLLTKFNRLSSGWRIFSPD